MEAASKESTGIVTMLASDTAAVLHNDFVDRAAINLTSLDLKCISSPSRVALLLSANISFQKILTFGPRWMLSHFTATPVMADGSKIIFNCTRSSSDFARVWNCLVGREN